MSLTPQKDVFQAVMNVPVEIWQEIIYHILFNPILFATDPYYPGCNLHTAIDEWSDDTRLLKLEVQRGTLRLVSRSWKALIDASLWQYFEPFRFKDGTQQIAQSRSAYRLEYFHPCVEEGHIAGANSNRCPHCDDYVHCKRKSEEPWSLGDQLLKARIVRFPVWSQVDQYLDEQKDHLNSILPNLRALFISVNVPLKQCFLYIFSSLTFLSIRIERLGQGLEGGSPVAHSLCSLKILHLETGDGGDDVNFFEQWEMPLLAHVQVVVTAPEPDLRLVSRLIGHVGRTLVSLRLHFEYEYVSLESNFWSQVPILEYLAVTGMDCSGASPALLGPPDSHQLHTFGLLYDEDYQETARAEASNIVAQCKCLRTIADSHYWEDVHRDFTRFRDGTRSVNGLKDLWSKEIILLQISCDRRGLEYVDSTGKTFAEFQIAGGRQHGLWDVRAYS